MRFRRRWNGAGAVVVVDRAGAKKTLSSGWADLYGLAWRPDGREVWFTAARRGEFKALRAVTLAGKERLVTRVMGQVNLEDISRDGRVLVDHPSFRFEMVARAPGESKERELTWLGLSAVADLSRDGSRVLFTEYPEGAGEGGGRSLYLKRVRDLTTQVSRLDPVTGRRELVLELVPPDRAGVVQPRGTPGMVAVSADAKSYPTPSSASSTSCTSSRA